MVNLWRSPVVPVDAADLSLRVLGVVLVCSIASDHRCERSTQSLVHSRIRSNHWAMMSLLLGATLVVVQKRDVVLCTAVSCFHLNDRSAAVEMVEWVFSFSVLMTTSVLATNSKWHRSVHGVWPSWPSWPSWLACPSWGGCFLSDGDWASVKLLCGSLSSFGRFLWSLLS